MAQHGIDGAFLQRFAHQCDLEAGNQEIKRIRDEVGALVKHAAEKEGRVFAIMYFHQNPSLLSTDLGIPFRYDVSGVPADRLQRVLEQDWNHLVRRQALLDSPNYLKERGQPVVGISGQSPGLAYNPVGCHLGLQDWVLRARTTLQSSFEILPPTFGIPFPAAHIS